MTEFFGALPTLSYNGVPAKNFMALAKLSDQTVANRTLFYPYTTEEGDRIDILSRKYYDNPDYAWLIWMTNNIVDPYHDVHLGDLDFHNFIVKKYTSLANAQNTIAYWVNDWASDESELSVATYDALDPAQQKYYNPVVDPNNVIIEYVRKQEDWKVTTNQIVSMAVTSNTAYTTGDLVRQRYAANSQAVANGIVVFSNTTACILQHIGGEFLVSNSSVVMHLYDSSNNVANTTSVDTQTCIPDDEVQYWSSKSYYDHEVAANASRRDIQLIDNRFKVQIANQLKRVMSE